MENYIKLNIIGPARSGKDTVAEILQEVYGLTFKSSSQAASDIFIFDALKEKYGYNNPLECFNDRVNRRAEWYNLICEYNLEDKCRLAKDILKTSDIYVGMRDKEEILECVKNDLFDLIIWVDASKRVPDEPASSFNITKDDADIIIDNNSGYDELRKRVIRLGELLTHGRADGMGFMSHPTHIT